MRGGLWPRIAQGASIKWQQQANRVTTDRTLIQPYPGRFRLKVSRITE